MYKYQYDQLGQIQNEDNNNWILKHKNMDIFPYAKVIQIGVVTKIHDAFGNGKLGFLYKTFWWPPFCKICWTNYFFCHKISHLAIWRHQIATNHQIHNWIIVAFSQLDFPVYRLEFTVGKFTVWTQPVTGLPPVRCHVY